MKIILFDIDGTLISTDGCGCVAMNRAYSELFGLKNALDGVLVAGSTDAAITANVFQRFEISWNTEHVDRLKHLYLSYLLEELEDEKWRKYLLPGLPCVLDELRMCSAVQLGLLTGNWREGARIKLSYFGLWNYFPFGAFGDDHHDRNQLLPFALRRMQSRQDSPIDHHRVFVIGDTPRDIQCGRPYNAVTIAVATGPYSIECLRNEDPHFVLPNLANVKDLLGIVRDHDVV